MSKRIVAVGSCNDCPNYMLGYCRHKSIMDQYGDLGRPTFPGEEPPEFCPLPTFEELTDSYHDLGRVAERCGF